MTAGATRLSKQGELSVMRWGVPREPVWEDGVIEVAPGAGTALVSKTVSTGMTGRAFGVHITVPEANIVDLYNGAVFVKRFVFGLAGFAHLECPQPLLDNAAAGTVISLKNVNAASALKEYQASLLYDEA
jgi:hypothetical protein